MEITDDYIINFFYGNSTFIKRNHIKEYPEEIRIYLENRYTDSESIYETIFRIKHNIEKRPVCPICGKPVLFVGKNSKYYQTYCSRSCLSKGNVNKIKEKYGTNCTLTLNSIKEKTKNTLLQKYGVEHNWSIPSVRKQCVATAKEKYGDNLYTYIIPQKSKVTCLEKYGYENYRNTELAKQTLLNKFGVDSVSKINTVQNTIQKKRLETLKEHNTFNTSAIEQQLKDYFDSNNINYIYQYKSESYPFNCDFYFPDKDLYVEIQGNWTHGFKPYENTNEDNILVEQWKSKKSKYYNNAIETWTIRDVNKRNIAKQNNLNYLEIFSINFNECLSKINYYYLQL